jgi:hypothetical protein
MSQMITRDSKEILKELKQRADTKKTIAELSSVYSQGCNRRWLNHDDLIELQAYICELKRKIK